MNTAYTCAACITPLETIPDAVVLVEDGTVISVDSRNEVEIPANTRIIDLADAILAPGYIDIHIHGSIGHDTMEATPDALSAIERFLFAHGTTSYFPTTITAPVDSTLRALDGLADSIESHETSEMRARPLGIHLEGPFISREKRGVHPEEDLQDASLELFERFWQAARGNIKIITIAPEIPGAGKLIREAVRRGVCVSLGHSNASLSEATDAIAAGASHTTHIFNGMHPIEHRDPGIVGAVLTDDRVSAEIIADGIHVDPAIVRLFLAAKGVEGAVLITDGSSATGMPNGKYNLGGITVEMLGNACLHEGRLAGSVLTLDSAVRNVMRYANWPLEKAVRLVTLNPAKVTAISGKKGEIRVDADADFVVLSPKGEVLQTIRA